MPTGEKVYADRGKGICRQGKRYMPTGENAKNVFLKGQNVIESQSLFE